MRKISKNSILLLVLMVSLFSVACKRTQDKEASQEYTCPMHPDIIKNHPDACPICGMDLVLIHKNHIDIEVGKDLENLLKTSNEAVLSNIETIKPKEDNLSDTIKLDGVITFNSNQTKNISTYVSGRIEKLYVKYNFQKINKGQKIMEIYSPDLVSAQQELLYLKEAGDLKLMEQAKIKLSLLGLSQNQINQLINSNKVNHQIAIYSKYDGYIIENNENSNNSALSLREGMYVNSGDALFKIFDNKEVWAEFSSSADKLNSFKKGDLIKISKFSGDSENAKISLIQPYFKDNENFTTLRVVLKNPSEKYKIGELLNAEIINEDKTGLWIPVNSVFITGHRSIVFVKSDHILKPKVIETGEIINEKILVLNGITKEDSIAKNAAYLIDSESFILIDKN
jgi:Cu(I)/Ag(I) efflux system membrane fusion protein